MDVDPLEHVEDDDEKKDGGEKPKSNLNRWVAVTVAILATFMGICKVKDDNIVQAMQQAQADKIDNFAWYQARNIREDVARATSAQLTAQLAAAPAANQAAIQQQLDTYNALAKDQEEKKKQQQDAAEQADKTYNQLNLHDDQFDMADAALSIAISLLAVTALTQKRWLFFLALLPTLFGLLMGLAGLLGWSLHPDAIARLLS
jgi:hypothetical protein